jgi:hypothetical protein
MVTSVVRLGLRLGLGIMVTSVDKARITVRVFV